MPSAAFFEPHAFKKKRQLLVGLLAEMGFGEDDEDHLRHQHGRVFLQKQGIGLRRKSKSFDVRVTSLASIESLSVPLVQEVVLSADIRCAECQKRVAEVMSRMNGTESVVVNVLEKKVTLSCKYPNPKTPRSKGQVASYRTMVPLNKISVIKQVFGSSLT